MSSAFSHLSRSVTRSGSSVTRGLFSAWSSSRRDGQPHHGIAGPEYVVLVDADSAFLSRSTACPTKDFVKEVNVCFVEMHKDVDGVQIEGVCPSHCDML